VGAGDQIGLAGPEMGSFHETEGLMIVGLVIGSGFGSHCRYCCCRWALLLLWERLLSVVDEFWKFGREESMVGHEGSGWRGCYGEGCTWLDFSWQELNEGLGDCIGVR